MDPAAVRPEDPRTFNRFAYANNSPYKYTDPDGRNPVAGAAAGCAVTGPACPAGATVGAVLGTLIAVTGYVVYNESTDDGEKNTGTVDDLLKGTEPDNDHKKSPKSDQRKNTEGGGFDKANDQFDNVGRPKNVKDRGDGVRTGELDDGSIITVRPKSSPTISINSPGNKKEIKIRY